MALILVTNDDGIHAPGLAALAEALRAAGRGVGGRARARAERVRPRAHAAPAAAAAPVGRAAIRGQRHAVGLREPRRPRLPARAAGARRLRRQSRLQPRRRRDVLGHGVGGHGGHAARRAVDRRVADRRRRRRHGRRGWRGWSPCACWSRGCRPRRCSTSTCRRDAARDPVHAARAIASTAGKVVEQNDPRGRTHYWLGGGPPEWEAARGHRHGRRPRGLRGRHARCTWTSPTTARSP